MAKAPSHEQLTELIKRVTDDGRLVEAGWLSLRLAAISPDAPEIQLEEMRNAFFAGAQHLLSSITQVLDPGEEPTAADLQRMDSIQRELDEFITVFSAKHGLPAQDGRMQ